MDRRRPVARRSSPADGLGIAFQYFAIAPMRGLGRRKGLVEAAKADFLSLSSFEIGLFGWMALTQLVFFPTTSVPTTPPTSSSCRSG